ncbi:hypothetical protein [Paracoccus sp. IB05]|uniref:hypothetical protein n=1 Tax=Paracoccus sp. IB05 TaxID=2779367 RepID=UPI0018E76467|nr:hypothetical protein [Paracoccus sp. IB05]MBJ2149666.1 hypothetical protein [Paracoccus sp. IB05]
MQHHRTEAAPARQSNQSHPADFDFGQARATGKPRKTARPGLTAGLIGFAFAVSMFMPVGAKAEAAWQRYPDQLSEPARPGILPEVLNVDSKRGMRPGWDKPHRLRLPGVCALQIDGRRGYSGYSENCLRNQGLREKLPRDCGTAARVFGQRDRLFSAACLRDFGYMLRD